MDGIMCLSNVNTTVSKELDFNINKHKLTKNIFIINWNKMMKIKNFNI